MLGSIGLDGTVALADALGNRVGEVGREEIFQGVGNDIALKQRCQICDTHEHW